MASWEICKRIQERRIHRAARGSVIAEFGPAVFLALVVFLFPVINLIGLTISYANCLYLSDLVLRRAAVEPDLLVNPNPAASPGVVQPNTNPATITQDLNQVAAQWSSGFGKLAVGDTVPAVSYNVDAAAGTEALYAGQSFNWPVTWYVNTTVVCQCKPLVPIPFFLSVPGLNAPVTFQFKGKTLTEYIPAPNL